MVFDITHLKKIRKQLNLTQNQFAKEAGVSQSMIAKIESGKLDPTYSHVQKIEQALNRLTKQEEKEAKDFMHHGIIAASKKDSLHKVIEAMTKHNISQVPVMEGKNVIGLVTESLLLEYKEKTGKKVTEIMIESPPIISENTKLSVVIQLLKFCPIVIVAHIGTPKGVITKSDIIKKLS